MNQSIEPARRTDPLAALRQATAERHARLDGGLPLAADDASLDDYVAHLRMLRAWLLPLDAWMAGFADGPGADAQLDVRAHGRERLALIDADLHDAHLHDSDRRARAAPSAYPAPAPGWPPDASAAYRWGVCYVVEGSQLGGAVLYQRLGARLAPHPLRYLQGAAGGPGPRWRAFMLALRAAVRSDAEIADACAGACAAFDRILALAGQCDN